MDTVTRRRFLIASGVTGGAALAAGAAGIGWDQLRASTAGSPQPPGTRTLVLVTLYGGNDGLNTVVPYADKAYHDARPGISYSADEVLHLDDGLGLNPAMKGFASLWTAGKLAIVRGAGYPKPDLSHFRSMDIWQTASPSTPVQTGWIGRWLDVTGDDPLRAVSIGPVLPPLAVGARTTAAALDPGRDQPLAAATARAFTGLGHVQNGDTSAQASVRAGYRAERVASAAFAKAMGSAPATGSTGTASVAAKGGALALQLDAIARCIAGGVPAKVYAASLGGFDTHAGEKQRQSQLLGTLDSAITDFLAKAGDDVVVLVYSEFGRRVRANASEGTDHGTAAPMFVAGTPVRGGFYGEQPSLTDLDDGDLKFTVDFRAVYAELVDKLLGTDPARVLDAVPDPLGFLS